MINKFKLTCLAFFSLFINNLIAGDETRSSRAYANNLVSSAFIQTEDDKFTGSGGWNSSFTTLANRGVVEIGIDEEKHIWHSGAFAIWAKYDVQITDASLNVTTLTNQTLTVNYNSADLTRYTDRAQVIYPNAYKIKVYNIVFTTCPLNTSFASCTSPYTQADAYIETNVTTAKAYNFGFSTSFSLPTDLNHTVNSTTQEMEISWNTIVGAEEYELEYTFVDSYSSIFGSSAQVYDFEHDATRIVTTFNSYFIPLTFERGTIIYRVRPIGRSNSNQRIEGAWYGAPVAGSIPGSYSQAVNAFNADKFNWSGVKTFAENGKSGVGVNFLDALGYSRQNIARLNTDAKSIVQNTLFDYYGRPTINVLPAPLSGKDFNYRLALNMYKATSVSTPVLFDKQIFGLCTSTNNICASGAFTLDPASSNGAPKYYSASNPNKDGYQGFVPDAEYIPYTQVKYKSDGLNRLEKQTLPGGLHTIGSSKEIKYYYAQPTQVELDRIFGSEAGRAKYHYKNITIDPNGQTSAAYVDNSGRVIATFLMGLNPLNVDALPNMVSTVTLTETLHVPPTNDPDPVNKCKEVNTTFFVSSASIEGYIYHTTLGSFASTCITNPVCYDCVYDLELSIKDDCGNEVFDYDANVTTAPGFTASIGKQPPYIPVTCGSGPTGTLIAGATLNTPINITFPKAGVYSVYKKICVSDDPVIDYTNHFVDNRCDDKKCSLMDSILSMMDFSACNLTMTCSQCNELVNGYSPSNGTVAVSGTPVDLGGGQIYTPTVAVNAGTLTPQQLSEALENCDKLCPPKTTCEKYKKALLMDFYPGGQYADTVVNGPKWQYSIFNASNSLPSNIQFNTGTLVYQNAIGNADFVQLNNVNIPILALTKIQYIQYYRKSWAKALLQYHPEYCKMQFYCTDIGLSMDYDDKMLGINHYDSACAAGYFFPINTAFATYTPQSCAASNYDPFISLGSLSTAFNNTVTSFVNQISTNFNGASNTSIPVFDIYRYVMCQTNSAAASGFVNDWLGKDSCRQDKDWLLFKQFYIGKKAALYQNLESIYFLNPSAYGCTGSVNPPSGYLSHFPNISNTLNTLFASSSNSLYVAMNTPTAPMTPTASSSFTSALNSLNTTMNSSMNSTLTSQCTTACNSYTNYWYTTLNSGCIAFGNASSPIKNNIINALVGVCMNGCDYNSNLAGASTTSPGNGYILPATSVTVTSFQQVLNYYLTGSISTSVCSSIILTQPGPYPASTPTAQTLSSCKCDQILKNESDYYQKVITSQLPLGVNSSWKLFRYVNGFDLPEYNILKCICRAATNNTWSPGHTWTTPQLNALAQNTMAVNPKLKCNSCMKCTDVVTAIEGLFSQLTNTVSYVGNVIGAITQDSTNQIFAIASLNNTFGSHPFQDYLDLYADCKAYTATATAQTFTNTITDEALDLFRYMNQLVQDKYLVKVPGPSRPAKLCTDSKYFLSSLYNGALPNTPATLNYSYTITGNNLNFQIKNSSTIILSVNLTYPLSYTGNWQSFNYLANMVAYCPIPVSGGNNYGFQVQATDNLFSTVTLTGSIANSAFPITVLSSGASPVPQLCPKKPKKINTCAINLVNSALTQANMLNQIYLDSLKAQFQNNYKNACYNSINETFIRKYNGADEYEYTLFYYDESGNLQRTIAPNGVIPLISVVAPITGSPIYPAHSNINGVDLRYVNDYRYSTYNQPLIEKTIDGGVTKYYYDEVGRIMGSQNAKQAALSTATNFVYSYTLYDDFGRVKELGQMTTINTFASAGQFVNSSFFAGIVSAATRTQVTQTYYDDLPSFNISTIANTYFALSTNTLSNLRNRVACVMYKENPASPYDFATYYSYDDHGNVKHMVQENNTLPLNLQGDPAKKENLFKIIDYKYELMSGNMVQAIYQKDFPDQLIHNYFYDADNRLHEVYTSFDNVNFDMDAKYFYYEHGPLARVERADKQVQGSDYMYTIHRWIKGINGEALNINSDAGKDGTANNSYLSSYNKIHNYFAQDAMSFSLNYYNSNGKKDYKAIKDANFNTTTDINPQMSLSNLYNNTLPFYLDVAGAGNGASLYNGNISSMVTSFIDKDPINTIANKTPFPLLTGYRYDQLHRITKMRSFRSMSNNSWNAPSISNYDDSYRMDLSYDPNGNIQTLFRNGADPTLSSGSNLAMDDLFYSYYKSVIEGGVVTNNSYNSNKLACVTDNVPSSNYTDDIDFYNCTERSKRYEYDEIGNLTKDNAECIDEIVWSTDRKVREVKRSVSELITQGKTLPDVEYQYNAMRQRVVKIVKPRDPSTKALKTPSYWLHTYYVYDASGNVMATYDRSTTNIATDSYQDKVSLSELDIYGSDRLALARPSNTLSQWSYSFVTCGGDPDFSTCRTMITTINPTLPNFTSPYKAYRALGYKEFELDNHLGNVIATVSDRKIPAAYDPGSCIVVYDMNSGVPATIYPQNMTLAATGGSLQCTIQMVGISGIDSKLGTNIPAGSYLIEYDWDPGTLTVADGVFILPFDHNGTFYFGSYFCDGTFVPPAGHYSFVYTPTMTGPAFSTYLAFYTYAPISNNSFKIDNLSMCPLNAPPAVTSYTSDILMHTDYYAFGQEMPARKYVASDYRYSFNGKEKDKDLSTGAQNFGMREYDQRIGRFFNRDPFTKYLPNKTPYAFAGNSPITFLDEGGGYMIVPEVCGVSGEKLKALQEIAMAVSTLAKENAGDNEFVTQFMIASGLNNRTRALEILTYGSGPIVVVSNDPDIMNSARGDMSGGKYHGANLSSTKEFIFINSDIISGATGKKNGRGDGQVTLNSQIVGLIALWHEGIHYADNLDCNPQKGVEPGILGENNLFGYEPGYGTLSGYRAGKPVDNNGILISNPQPLNNKPTYFLGDKTSIKDFWDRANKNQNTIRGFNPAYNTTKIIEMSKEAFKWIQKILGPASYGNDRYLD
jgi:RHS repeat-associated protein